MQVGKAAFKQAERAGSHFLVCVVALRLCQRLGIQLQKEILAHTFPDIDAVSKGAH